MNKRKLEEQGTPSLPFGYDSIYVYDDEMEGTSSEGGSSVLLQHEYVLNRSIQIEPQYLVRFSLVAAPTRIFDDDVLLDKLGESVNRVRVFKAERNAGEQRHAISDTKQVAEDFLKNMEAR